MCTGLRAGLDQLNLARTGTQTNRRPFMPCAFTLLHRTTSKAVIDPHRAAHLFSKEKSRPGTMGIGVANGRLQSFPLPERAAAAAPFAQQWLFWLLLAW